MYATTNPTARRGRESSLPAISEPPRAGTRLTPQLGRATRLDWWNLYLDEANRTRPDDLEPSWCGDAVETRVPHVWEQIRPGHDGVGWYRHALFVPDVPSGDVWRLRVSAANYRAEVFLNGDLLARHDGGYTPFVTDLSPRLLPGENELLLRVVDPPREYPVEGLQSSHPLRQTALPTYKAGWYYSFGGLWQPVHLLRTAPLWLEDAFIQPRVDPRAVRIEWSLEGDPAPGRGDALAYEIRSVRDGTVFASGREEIFQTRGVLEAALPGAPLWSCADPHLLELRMTLTTFAGRDERTWRFGLREFTTDGKRFFLNNEPLHLRGVLHQGGFPRTLSAPQDAEMARRDIMTIKEAGCNLSRITLRPASPMELDLCDELGLLVIGEPPIGWIAYDAEIDERCLREVEEMIRRDRNRPSVVMWTLLNEFTDTVYFRRRDPAALIRAACALGTRLDPTRLMSGNSGRGGGDALVANGLFGQGREAVPLLDEHIYLRNFPSRADLESIIIRAGEGEEGLLFVSEFGTSGFPDMDAVLARYTPEERHLGLEDYRQMKNYRDEIAAGWEAFGLRDQFPTLSAFCHALAFDQMEMVRIEQRALRLNPRVAGYVITQGADISSEFGGIVDLWREPKRVYPVFRDLNRDQVVLLDVPQHYATMGQTLPVRTVVSDLSNTDRHWQGKVTLFHESEPHEEWEFSGKAGWSTELASREITLPAPGRWILQARARSASGLSIQDELPLTALAPPEFSNHQILLMDATVGPHGNKLSKLGHALEKLGLRVQKYSNQDNDPHLPVVVHLQGRDRTLNYFEKQRVLRREVEAGRSAFFIDCDLAYLHYFFGDQTPREIYGNGAFAGNMGFGFDREIFRHLGPELQIGPAYGSCYPRIFAEARQVQKNGGEILALHAMPYQFGRPDSLQWGASLYTQRFGRGQVWVCSFSLFAGIKQSDPVSLDLFDRFLRSAAKFRADFGSKN